MLLKSCSGRLSAYCAFPSLLPGLYRVGLRAPLPEPRPPPPPVLGASPLYLVVGRLLSCHRGRGPWRFPPALQTLLISTLGRGRGAARGASPKVHLLEGTSPPWAGQLVLSQGFERDRQPAGSAGGRRCCSPVPGTSLPCFLPGLGC